MKRMLSFLLALAVCLSLFATVAVAAVPFTDVPEKQWYYDDVVSAHEMGLIDGKTATLFKPDDNLTYAEAVKLAACMNQRYTTGSVSLKNGKPWYQTYVDYCKIKGIISVDYAWDQPATRAGYMEIFANALPGTALQAVNNVPDGTIPDVPMTHNQADAIYKLYRAGIVQGSDAAHNCNPASVIKRSEVAAILTRMMDSDQRISFYTVKPEEVLPLTIVTHPSSVESKEGEIVTLVVEAEGGTMPYSFEWLSVSDKKLEPITGIPGVEIFGDSNSSRAQIKVGGPNDWTTNEPIFCIVTDSKGYSVSSRAAEISVKLPPEPLTIDYESPDRLLTYSDPSFTLTFSGGEGPYVTIWEMKLSERQWINVDNLPNVKTYESGWERTCQIEGNVQDTTILRCVIFDSLGNSVTSREFYVFLN